MTTDEYVEVYDPYLAAYALAQGVELAGIHRSRDTGKHSFQFATAPMQGVMTTWRAQRIPADLRAYLTALRFLRQRMWGQSPSSDQTA